MSDAIRKIRKRAGAWCERWGTRWDWSNQRTSVMDLAQRCYERGVRDGREQKVRLVAEDTAKRFIEKIKLRGPR